MVSREVELLLDQELGEFWWGCDCTFITILLLGCVKRLLHTILFLLDIWRHRGGMTRCQAFVEACPILGELLALIACVVRQNE